MHASTKKCNNIILVHYIKITAGRTNLAKMTVINLQNVCLIILIPHFQHPLIGHRDPTIL